MRVEFGLLGEVTARVDGRAVDLGPARQRCVLAALAVDVGRAVPAERLVARVWGPDTPRRGTAALHSYISRLRRVLAGAAGVVRRSGGYALVAHQSGPVVDLERFRALRARGDEVAALTEALALWRGEPLTGLSGEWAAAERERLRRERLAAQHDLVDARLRAGEGEGLVVELSARAAEHPLDERVAGQYLLALHRAGRSADALEQYRRVRDRLADELGADPGRPLRELHRRILADDPALTPPPGDGQPAPAALAGRPAAPGDRQSEAPGEGPGDPRPEPEALADQRSASGEAPGALPASARESGDALPASQAPGDRRPVPRQLPAEPPHFTGRVAELAVLHDHLAAAGPGRAVVISAIAGSGGIGKTWLALHFAHRHADRFPDGQLFVDLRGFSPEGRPMEPAVAVRGFLDALGVDPGRLPVDPHAQAALFRSLVADRRMLVVLDNAADTAQVAPLLPGGRSCAVLVTSRTRLPGLVTGHGAHHVPLDVLSAREAHALLTARLGVTRVAAEPAAVGELVALCGGFPLALSIVAGQAHTRPDRSLADLATELRDLGLAALADDDPAASLPAVLSWSRRTLAPSRLTAFALLGTAPGPDTGLPAAASLLGLPVPQARAVLRDLERTSLVVQDAAGRYRMHDLIRCYAFDTAEEHAPEPDRAAALRRVVDYYAYTAHAAERRLNPTRQPIDLVPPAAGIQQHPVPDDPTALAWFDAERANLRAAQRTAATHNWHDPVWYLAWTTTTFHDRRGHRDEQIAMWEAALRASAHLPGLVGLRVHELLGRTYAGAGRHDDAIEHLHKALTLAERHDDPSQQAHAHYTLAWTWELHGDDRKALDHATRALDQYRDLDHAVWAADALSRVGWYTARLGEHGTARTQCETALAQHRRHRNTVGEADTLDSLGYIAHHTGHHEESVRRYQEAIALYRRLSNHYDLATTLEYLGHPYAALGRHEEARDAWREALELYRDQARTPDAERVQARLAPRPTSTGRNL
ncbi:AfsR/SARP family transcriptional regulator [Saccharothrix obliqua]|uniref:AfsR/SARP family transcriptional regulator n=1 Tax=Saccharothrix obliqua TaxID=2861747 RepID=UPI001C5F7916|nr:BTAD domain-containing putative transcriptional regulator [Saccharothrix obliqua]MBW4718180.1 tetratricopeptide repeat protein [Saccharothrix obliqua]